MAWTDRTVGIDDFEWDEARRIGAGAISNVFAVKHSGDGRTYAVKRVQKSALVSTRKVDAAFNEKASLIAQIENPRVVTLYTTFQTHDSLFFVLDYFPRGNLEMLVLGAGPLPTPVVVHVCACVVAALESVHRSGWVLRDVKPENCCFDGQGYVSLIDFDTAQKRTADTNPKPMKERTKSVAELPPDVRAKQHSAAEIMAMRRKTETFAGTAQYISPEMLDSCDFSHASDLWALGCVCYLAAVGRPAFNAASQFEVFRKVVHCSVKYPPDMDERCKDFCQRLLVTNPVDRMGVVPGPDDPQYMAAIRTHPLFEGVDWERYAAREPPPFEFPAGAVPAEDAAYLSKMLDPGLAWDPWAEGEADEAAPEAQASSPRHEDPCLPEDVDVEETPQKVQFASRAGGAFVFPPPAD